MKRQPTWVVITGFVAIFLFLLAPGKYDFPAAVFGIIAFIAVQFVWPECRLKIATPLCPLNLSQALFAVQLLLLPLIGMFDGFARGTLPRLPSNYAINVALVVNTIAYLAFSGSYHHFSRKAQKAIGKAESPEQAAPFYPFRPMRLMVFAYLFVGLLGFFFYYENLGGYINYLSLPSSRELFEQRLAGTLQGVAAILFRPFLGFSIVMAWSLLIDRCGHSFRMPTSALLTVLVVVVLILINASYNRGTVLGPVLAIAAAYSARVRRLSFGTLALVVGLLLSAALIWGAYRQSNLTINDLVLSENVASLVEELDTIEILQVYGASQQFLGFFLEETNLGADLYWGKTLLSSLLSPVPVVGKEFRSTSGVVIYNLLIYSDETVIDQVVPFQGELFINFHILGVMVGYILLGYVTVKMQRRFELSWNTLEAYSWFLIAIWTLFLIPGSLSVTSQMYIFFFWPIYIYFLLAGFRMLMLAHRRAV